MRLILEKNEIVAILGKHFDAELDPEKVVIRTEPFEIEVCGLPLVDAPAPAQARAESNVVALPTQRASRAAPAPVQEPILRDDPDASTEPPPPGNDGYEDDDAVAMHPGAVLEASKALEQELDRENPKLARRSGRWSHIAPTDHKDEI